MDKQIKIDTHVHFWQYNPKDFYWVTDQKIQKDFMPEDFEQSSRFSGIDGCINVQARFKYEENDFMFGLAKNNHFIKGIVCWVSLVDEQLDARMAKMVQNPKMSGVRDFINHCINEEGKLRLDFSRGLKTLEKYGKVFELVINEDQLADSIILAEQFPALSFVIDHMAKPKFMMETCKTWSTNMRKIAKYKNVSCKVSGLVNEAKLSDWHQDDFKFYLDVVFSCFPASRLVIGSDWPVCLRAGEYEHVMSIIEQYLESCSDQVKAQVYEKNALRVYGIHNQPMLED
jgi:L-fuconolactonase